MSIVGIGIQSNTTRDASWTAKFEELFGSGFQPMTMNMILDNGMFIRVRVKNQIQKEVIIRQNLDVMERLEKDGKEVTIITSEERKFL